MTVIGKSHRSNPNEVAMLSRNRQPQVQIAATHRNNLLKGLQHRIELARIHGNDRLVQQLEAEADYLE
jgi:hypothetical protein